MLSLLAFPAALDEPSLSPFSTKAMILLTMSGQTWRPKWTTDPRAAPFGKLPALESPQGVIGDSDLILAWLEEQGADLFPGLDSRRRAMAHGIMRMAEENLRYGLMYDRWVDDAGWARFSRVVFAGMPAPLRLIVPGMVRKDIVRGLKWQGLGRFGRAERLSYFKADLAALTDLLWDAPWLFGDRPTAADASVLPVLSSIDRLQVDRGLRGALRENDTLMAYIKRGRETLYAPLSAVPSAAA